MVNKIKLSSVLAVIALAAVAAGIIGTMRLQTGRECSRRRPNVSGLQAQYRSELMLQGASYVVRVEIGNPPKTQHLVIDTGSDVTWVQCIDCKLCYPHTDPMFNPAASTSFCHKACNSEACKSLGHRGKCQFFRNRCTYEVVYSGGSSVNKGMLMAEQIRLGSGVADVAMGCARLNEGGFAVRTGLMGLGRGSISFVNQLGVGVRDGFTYCLSSSPSAVGWLEFGPWSFPQDASWVPLVRNPKQPSFYYIKLFGIEVGGVRLPIPEDYFQLSKSGKGGVILDSGTTLTKFPRKIYEALRDEFTMRLGNLLKAPPRENLDTCYDLTVLNTVIYPNITFHFDGFSYTARPRAIFYSVDKIGMTYCFAFGPSHTSYSIIGSVLQRDTQISYDLRRGQVGFGPSC